MNTVFIIFQMVAGVVPRSTKRQGVGMCTERRLLLYRFRPGTRRWWRYTLYPFLVFETLSRKGNLLFFYVLPSNTRSKIFTVLFRLSSYPLKRFRGVDQWPHRPDSSLLWVITNLKFVGHVWRFSSLHLKGTGKFKLINLGTPWQLLLVTRVREWGISKTTSEPHQSLKFIVIKNFRRLY